MPVDVSSHPDFLARQAKKNADKAAAIASGDEAAQARVDAEWTAAVNQMTVDLYERQNVARDREATIARIKAENPAAPEAIFQVSDLTQMEAAAKQVQELANQRSGGSWSPSPTGSASGAPDPRPEDMTPLERENARLKELDEVSRKVMRRGRYGEGALADAERMQELSLAPLTDPAALQAYRVKQEEDRRAGRAAR